MIEIVNREVLDMIEQVKFGTTKEGAEASIYILENSNGMYV